MNRRRYFLLLLVLAPAVLAVCMLMGPSGLGLPDRHSVIFSLRLCRVLTGFLVGAALACAGAVLQALLRNPLAEPYVLGVSSGAGLGAALAIVSGLASVGMFAIPLSAFVCAALSLAVVYKLAATGGRLSIYGLILSGVIVSSLCSSAIMAIVALSPIEGIHSILWWMLGNLETYSGSLLLTSAILILCGSAALWMLSPEFNALSLGGEMAHHVGVQTKFAITIGLALATLITSTAVALAGLIGFVGLVIPHVMRRLTGPDHRLLIPASALAGGLFLALCDALGRTVLAPQELPVGVITALVGGPFFLVILRSRKKRGWIE